MFEELLEKLAIEFDRSNVPYMIIGGQAVLAYGEPRLTRDVDLTLGWNSDRVEDLMKIATSLGWKILTNRPKEFASETMVLPCQDVQSGIRVDCIFSFSAYEAEALKRVKKIPIGKATVSFASVEDLIVHKLVAGRPRDLEDVSNILNRNPAFDIAYLKRWLSEFEILLERPLLVTFENLRKKKEK